MGVWSQLPHPCFGYFPSLDPTSSLRKWSRRSIFTFVRIECYIQHEQRKLYKCRTLFLLEGQGEELGAEGHRLTQTAWLPALPWGAWIAVFASMF